MQLRKRIIVHSGLDFLENIYVVTEVYVASVYRISLNDPKVNLMVTISPRLLRISRSAEYERLFLILRSNLYEKI